MKDRLRALRGFNYPKDAATLAAVKSAGGLSQMTPEAREALMTSGYKRVEKGEFCDDMPAAAAELYLSRGHIERVPAAKPKKAGA